MALTTLKSLRSKHVFRYSSAAQTVNECSRDIDHYLLTYSVSHLSSNLCTDLVQKRHPIHQALSNMHAAKFLERIEAKLEVYYASTLRPMTGAITGITLIDATGRQHEVSMDFAKSYQVCVRVQVAASDTNKLRFCH